MHRPPRVLLACSGLDHARRGYESFARECFAALRDDPEIELELVKGSGPPASGERTVRVLRRDRLIAQTIGRSFRVRPYRIEALSFAVSLLPVLAARRPDIVYLSEWDTARALARLRPLVRTSFKLVLCNGGFADRGFEHLARVQELTPAAREHVLRRGGDPHRHVVLPLGFDIPARLDPATDAEREALRRDLHLPLGRPILTSVAALNRHHKRLDYVIEEVAALPAPRPFLLLVGEPDEETRGVRALAHERLGHDGYELRTVPAAQVPSILRASDAFVLASLAEAQGRALIEAMSQGLPCIAHDSPVLRFAGGGRARLADLSHRGALTLLLSDLERHGSAEAARAAHAYAYEQFSWERLRPRYVELFCAVAGDVQRTRWTSAQAEPAMRAT